MGIADRLFNLKKEKSEANLKAGEEFLEANQKKPGVVALPSGLQYEVISEGTGPKPQATNKVTCHYHGTLIDGTVFDSSVKRGQPATFPLNQVIKGWTEGLQLMPTGSKWRFFIPPHLGYGDRQVSAQIGPNSTLIFDVELISFT
jgi:FKBP-type peptidyl-prolyl cis-trans isomerase FklB